jgi:hypothetical protein
VQSEEIKKPYSILGITRLKNHFGPKPLKCFDSPFEYCEFIPFGIDLDEHILG